MGEVCEKGFEREVVSGCGWGGGVLWVGGGKVVEN